MGGTISLNILGMTTNSKKSQKPKQLIKSKNSFKSQKTKTGGEQSEINST